MIKLCFDYGHGGSDSGAIYKDRCEKDDVLKIGKAVADILRRHGTLVDETRTKDVTLSLKNRSDFEKKKKYDYFISFHRNAFKPEKVQGVETFIYINQTEKAKRLAEKVQKNLVNIGFINRGVKKINFHVLRETKSPAILIEIGFIDNSKDNALFDSKFNEITKAIAKAILDEVGINYIENSNEEVLYRVMVGSYSKKENAERQAEKLKKAWI
ncbi:N-acetylmuramoyl-L-alanine amidase [Tissierella sp. MSJ-40]|uniref:N-acetylmuramoyl-L-alanine amidase n=1 Tax=Tissierella simiarum TaxID=2841534 RepID=A0ABS6EBR7_9FIRM|nr:N-acetylmuramoyl-L-alanine amidase [Tissierella simiarum]MBU5439885.1 N-acetylmuramoyl-L-alanine amidase [Tissierella simiarum]